MGINQRWRGGVTAVSLSVVKPVNEYAGRFDELEEGVREVRRVITQNDNH